MEEQFVAIYLDFENLAISAEQTYPSKEKPLTLSPLVDFAANNRNICIKKAYSDWSRPLLAQYQNELNEYGFEMIHLPGTSLQGKNGADLRMTIDILEDMQTFPIITTFLLGSGDTDFIPLVRRILARGKKVIIVGFDNSVGNLVKNNCTEFKSMNELIGEVEESDESDKEVEKIDLDLERLNAKDLLIRYIKNRPSDEPILLAQLKYNLLRLQPSFSEKKLGFSSFKKFLESMEEDIVEKIENDAITSHPKVFFKDISTVPVFKLDKKEEVSKYISQYLKFNKDHHVRHEFAKNLLKLFKEQSIVSMHDMIEYLSNHTKNVSKLLIRKYVFALGSGRVFSYADKVYSGSLFSRPQKLNDSINTPEIIDKIYQKRILELILNRFSDVDETQIKEMLNSK